MAISRGATVTAVESADEQDAPWNISHTVDPSTAILLVFIASDPHANVSSVVWDGVGLTQISELSTGSNSTIEVWRLFNPSVTTGNIVINGPVNDDLLAIAVNYIEVDVAGTPIGAVQTSIATGTLSTTHSSAAGELIVGASFNEQHTRNFSPGSGVTEVTEIAAAVNNSGVMALGEKAGAASVDFAMSINFGSEPQAMIAFPLKPTAGVDLVRVANETLRI